MNAATVTERKAAHAANVLDAALRLASEGHRVFPVVRNGKAPAIEGGHNSATDDAQTIRGWFGPGGEFEGFNLGMRGGTQRRNEATGEAEHLAIIDLDIKNGKNGVQYLTEACKAKGLRLDDFEHTRIQRTPGGGLHLLYWAPQPIKQGADVLGERCGVDTRDAGGFVVVAPSTAQGRQYEWLTDAPIAPMGALAALFPIAPAHREANTTPLPGVDPDRAVLRGREYLKTAQPAREGQAGDTHTFKVAARLKDMGCTEAQALDLMAAHWNDECVPPWAVDELAGKVASAYRYGKEAPGAIAPEAVFDAAPLDPLTGAPAWTDAAQICEHADALAALQGGNAKRFAELRDFWHAMEVLDSDVLDGVVLDATLKRRSIDVAAIVAQPATLERADVQRQLAELKRGNGEAFRLLVDRLASEDVGKRATQNAANAGERALRVQDLDAERLKDGRAVLPYRPGNLVATVDDMEAALIADAGSDPVFSFASGYVSVRHARPVTVRELSGGEYPPMAIVHRYDPPSMAERITRSVRLESLDKDGKPKAMPVPDTLVRMMLSRHGGKAPPLTGIIEAPTVRPDGTVLDVEGYDAATGLLAVFNGKVFPETPKRPTAKQAAEARRFLEDELFAEFPFAEDVDRTVAVAALITGLVRPVMCGAAPGFLLSSPTQGTGKTALAQAISHGAHGRPPAATAWPASDEEMAKFLIATLREGQRAIVFDNLRDGCVVNSAQLATAMTSDHYTARLLGVSETVTVPTSVLWLLTGNNVRLAGDMPSRILKIYLDAKEERPDRRSFRRDLVGWVSENRPRIVASVITIVRAYIVAGNPKVAEQGTRFPAWDRMVRLPLIYAGGQDVGTKFDEAYQDDPYLSAWREVLTSWLEVFGAQPVSVAELLKRLQGGHAFEEEAKREACERLSEALRSALEGQKSTRFESISVGKRLRQFENRPLGGMRLRKSVRSHDKLNLWTVERTA